MIENAKQAQLTYDGVYLDCDEDPTTGKLSRETPVCGPALLGHPPFRINPCDSLCDFAPPSDESARKTAWRRCALTSANPPQRIASATSSVGASRTAAQVGNAD
jgi:hypothetical protein